MLLLTSLQYQELVSEDCEKSLSEVYGIEHLLRLFGAFCYHWSDLTLCIEPFLHVIQDIYSSFLNLYIVHHLTTDKSF